MACRQVRCRGHEWGDLLLPQVSLRWDRRRLHPASLRPPRRRRGARASAARPAGPAAPADPAGPARRDAARGRGEARGWPSAAPHCRFATPSPPPTPRRPLLLLHPDALSASSTDVGVSVQPPILNRRRRAWHRHGLLMGAATNVAGVSKAGPYRTTEQVIPHPY